MDTRKNNSFRSPEWNAPLVSLPDISQIINGESNSQPEFEAVPSNMPRSTMAAREKETLSGLAKDAAREAESVAKHVAEDVKEVVTEEKVAKEVESARHVKPSPANRTREELNAAKEPTPAVEKVERKPEPEALVDTEKQWWTNAWICAACIVVTLFVLTTVSDRNSPNKLNAVADNEPLHAEPLTEPEADNLDELSAPVVEMPAQNSNLAVEVAETQPVADPLPNDFQLDAPAGQPSQSVQAPTLAARENGLPEEVARDFDKASQELDSFLPGAVDEVRDAGEQFVNDASEFANQAVDQADSKYRDIQRYNPNESSLITGPANDRRANAGMIDAPANHSADFDTSNVQPEFDQNDPLGRNRNYDRGPDMRQDTFAQNDSYSADWRDDRRVEEPRRSNSNVGNQNSNYQRTRPESYLYPEDAVARAIDILRQRARR